MKKIPTQAKNKQPKKKYNMLHLWRAQSQVLQVSPQQGAKTATRATVSCVITVVAQHIQLHVECRKNKKKTGSDTMKTFEEDADDHSFVCLKQTMYKIVTLL